MRRPATLHSRVARLERIADGPCPFCGPDAIVDFATDDDERAALACPRCGKPAPVFPALSFDNSMELASEVR